MPTNTPHRWNRRSRPTSSTGPSASARIGIRSGGCPMPGRGSIPCMVVAGSYMADWPAARVIGAMATVGRGRGSGRPPKRSGGDGGRDRRASGASATTPGMVPGARGARATQRWDPSARSGSGSVYRALSALGLPTLHSTDKEYNEMGHAIERTLGGTFVDDAGGPPRSSHSQPRVTFASAEQNSAPPDVPIP